MTAAPAAVAGLAESETTSAQHKLSGSNALFEKSAMPSFQNKERKRPQIWDPV